MGNNLNQGHSSEEIGRMLLTLDNFTVEGGYLDENKVFTVAKLTPDGLNYFVGKVHVKQKELTVYRNAFDKCKEKVMRAKASHLIDSDVIENGKLVILIRQYFDKTLRKKLRTPPFFNFIEKIWIIYQCLLAVSELHDAHICHGDIKSENFLITSWNWVFLADIGSFYKPNFLQEGDLTSYKIYFGTGERPACYLPPEKFTSQCKDEPLTEEMDIFSLGCVIAEIWQDGQYLFTLADLLTYRKTKVLSRLSEIKLEPLNSMLNSMLSHNPSDRKSINHYLAFFSTYILPYGIADIYPIVKTITLKYSSFTPYSRILWIEQKIQSIQNNEAFLILAECITSDIRFVQTPGNMVFALNFLADLAENLADDSKLHRILPFFLSILQNKNEKSKVKVTCIQCIIQILDNTNITNDRDGHLFSEYIWTTLCLLANDESEYVKSELARSLHLIARIGIRFFKASLEFSEKQKNFEQEFEKFTDKFVRIFKALIVAKPESQVHTDLLSNFAEISEYLDKRSVLNNMIPIILSWLNKGDWYRSIILSQIPKLLQLFNSSEFISQIVTCIEDGLGNHNELVVFKTLKVLQIQKKLDKIVLEKILKTLQHPSAWIRETVTSILRSIILETDPIENFSILRPLIIKWINLPILSIGTINEEILQYLLPSFKRSELLRGEKSARLKEIIENFKTKEQKNPLIPSISDEKWKVFETSAEPAERKIQFNELSQSKLDPLELNGKVQAMFNEHTSAVTNLKIIQNTLVSASSEGILKLWSLNQLEPFKAIKSKDSFSIEGVKKINTLGVCGDTFFVSHEEGIEFLPQLRPQSKDFIKCEKNVKSLALTSFLFSNINQDGLLRIFDTRLMKAVQSFQFGVIGPCSNMCQGPGNSLLCLSTYTGAIAIYDARFVCPSSILYHSSGLPIFTIHGYGSHSLLVASEEISLLDLHKNTVSLVLSSSNDSPRIPAFCETLEKDFLVQSCFNISSRAQKVFETPGITRKLISPGYPYIISGGNDTLTKIWNIEDPKKSFTLGQNKNFSSNYTEINYGDLRIIQQSQVPAMNKEKKKSSEEIPMHRKLSHSDAILDIELIFQPKPLIITGSRDGSIRVWN